MAAAGKLSTEEMFDRIYVAIRRVPRGRVATYGQIASMIGFPRHSRMVGRALRALSADSDLQWHRIVNAAGEISDRERDGPALEQRQLLETEKVSFDANGRIDLEEFRWEDDDRPERSREMEIGESKAECRMQNDDARTLNLKC